MSHQFRHAEHVDACFDGSLSPGMPKIVEPEWRLDSALPQRPLMRRLELRHRSGPVVTISNPSRKEIFALNLPLILTQVQMTGAFTSSRKDLVEAANGRVAGRNKRWRTRAQRDGRLHARSPRSVELSCYVRKKEDLTAGYAKRSSDPAIASSFAFWPCSCIKKPIEEPCQIPGS